MTTLKGSFQEFFSPEIYKIVRYRIILVLINVKMLEKGVIISYFCISLLKVVVKLR